MSTQNRTAKYRPSLSAEQVYHILDLAKNESPLSSLSITVIATLAPFQAKIDNLGLKPAYITSPRVSKTSLEALGEVLDYPSSRSNRPKDLESPIAFNKEQAWLEAYNKYSSNPSSCSLEEIIYAKEHMYLNDLMTLEEREQFEQNL